MVQIRPTSDGDGFFMVFIVKLYMNHTLELTHAIVPFIKVPHVFISPRRVRHVLASNASRKHCITPDAYRPAHISIALNLELVLYHD
jgi:hypothetical protein